MRLLDEFIDAGLDGPLGIQAMAGLLELSEGYFMRAFKNATGKSPHSYLIDRRLTKARASMRDSRFAIRPPGCRRSHSPAILTPKHYMTAAFKLRLGVSPAQLRRRSAYSQS
jgi:AraC family transcriptional regulator